MTRQPYRNPDGRTTAREVGVVAAILATGSEKAAAHQFGCRTQPSSTTWRTPGPRMGRRRRRSSCGFWRPGCPSPRAKLRRTNERWSSGKFGTLRALGSSRAGSSTLRPSLGRLRRVTRRIRGAFHVGFEAAIEISRAISIDGDAVASGGRVLWCEPWRIDDGALTATNYRWRPGKEG